MMPDMDPSKIVAMIENLFGPKLGRFLATSLLAFIVIFAFFWLSKGIWTSGGKEVFDAISSISVLENIALDSAQAATSTFLTFLILYGLAFVTILYFLGRILFRKNVSQAALDKLAELRNKGIDTVYAVGIKNDDDLNEWIKTKDDWMDQLRGHVQGSFPHADYLFVSHLGVVNSRTVDVAFNEKHRRELCYVIRQMDIVEQILNSYRN